MNIIKKLMGKSPEVYTLRFDSTIDDLPKTTSATDLYEFLNTHLKVILTLYSIREWAFDSTRTIVFDKLQNVFYIKYVDSPLPYSITVDSLFTLVQEFINIRDKTNKIEVSN